MRLVTIEEAAKILGCSRANVYRVIDEKKINTPEIVVTKTEQVERRIKMMHVDIDEIKGVMKKG